MAGISALKAMKMEADFLSHFEFPGQLEAERTILCMDANSGDRLGESSESICKHV